MRAPDGTVTTFDPPDSDGTLAFGINSFGAIAGSYWVGTSFEHGFVRVPGGAIETFDPQGSVYTIASCINDKGAITGSYYDSNFVIHGFVRSRQ